MLWRRGPACSCCRSSLGHIRLTATLQRHHGDPFDRLLVAQALDEGLVLVTADGMVQRYPVAWLW